MPRESHMSCPECEQDGLATAGTQTIHAPTSTQAFSQDSKSGRPKCAIGPAQINNLLSNIGKIKQFSLKSGPQSLPIDHLMLISDA